MNTYTASFISVTFTASKGSETPSQLLKSSAGKKCFHEFGNITIRLKKITHGDRFSFGVEKSSARAITVSVKRHRIVFKILRFHDTTGKREVDLQGEREPRDKMETWIGFGKEKTSLRIVVLKMSEIKWSKMDLCSTRLIVVYGSNNARWD